MMNRVFLISAIWWVFIFHGNAIETFNKGFDFGRKCPEVQWRGKYHKVCFFDLWYQCIEIIFLNTWFSIAAEIAAKSAINLRLVQIDQFNRMSGILCAFHEGFDKLGGVSIWSTTTLNHKYLFHKTSFLWCCVFELRENGGKVNLCHNPSLQEQLNHAKSPLKLSLEIPNPSDYMDIVLFTTGEV